MTNNPTGSVEKYRLAIWFKITGDRRFLSHRDAVRLWHQTLSRSRVPVRYSQGFNPRMKLSLPMPRNVAMASLSELLIVELTEKINIDSLIEKLNANLPKGIAVLHGRYVTFEEALYPIGSTYELKINTQIDQEKLQEEIDKFNSTEQLVFTRPSRGRHPVKYLDLKVTVASLELKENIIHLRMTIFRTGTSRIDEVMKTLGINLTEDIIFIERTTSEFGSQIELQQNIAV